MPAICTPACGVALMLMLVGCGKSGSTLAEVSGRVTLDGQPLVGAQLDFQPEHEAGSPSFGLTDADGRYELSYKRDVKGGPDWLAHGADHFGQRIEASAARVQREINVAARGPGRRRE